MGIVSGRDQVTRDMGRDTVDSMMSEPDWPMYHQISCIVCTGWSLPDEPILCSLSNVHASWTERLYRVSESARPGDQRHGARHDGFDGE